MSTAAVVKEEVVGNKEELLVVARDYTESAKVTLEHIAKKYGITLLFAGLFGSRAKGYAGPDSDYDLYVVYHGPLIQYAKVIDWDTRQLMGEPILPAQISFTSRRVENLSINGWSFGPDGVEPMASGKIIDIRVQLNFVSYDFFVQEINRSNLDFRLALDNIVLKWCNDSLVNLTNRLANCSFDPNKYKHTSYGRASAAAGVIKQWEEVRRSEITDGLYRLLMGWASTSLTLMPYLAMNRSFTLPELMDYYLDEMGEYAPLRRLRKGIDQLIVGDWKAFFNQYAGDIANAIDHIIPIIKAREIQNPPTYLVDKTLEAKQLLIHEVNTAFVGMLLKGGK